MGAALVVGLYANTIHSSRVPGIGANKQASNAIFVRIP